MEFAWKLWGKNVIRAAIKALIAWIGAETLVKFGVQVDVEVMVAALFVAIEGLHNYLKHKVGVKGI